MILWETIITLTDQLASDCLCIQRLPAHCEKFGTQTNSLLLLSNFCKNSGNPHTAHIFEADTILLRTVEGQPYYMRWKRAWHWGKKVKPRRRTYQGLRSLCRSIYMYKLHVEHQAVNHPSMVSADWGSLVELSLGEVSLFRGIYSFPFTRDHFLLWTPLSWRICLNWLNWMRTSGS